MGFGDLKAKAGQQALNDYLADKSYIEGYTFKMTLGMSKLFIELYRTPPSTSLALSLNC